MAAPQDERTPEDTAIQTQPETATGLADQPEIITCQGVVIIPESSAVHSEDTGIRAHTNTLIFVP
jgi:3D (Asp-Asp-Asp) domain-containing protein